MLIGSPESLGNLWSNDSVGTEKNDGDEGDTAG